MPRRVRMSPVDTAWLRMDSPGNLMMIVGVDIFDGPCDLPRLRELLRSHLLRHRNFRSRVVMDPSGAWWEEVEHFDIDYHLVRIGLPGHGGTAELQKLVAQLASQALDPTKPLWQFHLVENYDHGHAMIVRIHHCIADGIALIGVLLGMASADPGSDAEAPQRRRRDPTGPLPWLEPLTRTTVRAMEAAGDLTARAFRAWGAMITDPQVATDGALRAAHMASQVSRDAAALALMAEDTPTSLKGKPSGAKVVAWNEPLPLPDIKSVGRALECSLNDVLLACAAGAIRGYLLERGDALGPDAELRAMVPVNLRPAGDTDGLGNKFGLVPLLLPIGIEHPVERVLEVHRRMEELKAGYMPVLAMVILGATGVAPRVVQRQVLDMLASKATAVMTNVPGPREPLYMAGSRLRQMMFWVPQSGDIGMGVSILSYAGGVQFGLVTDRALCDNPQAIIDRFVPEFENLVHAVLLMPWEEGADRDLAKRSLAATESLAQAATHLSSRAGGAGEGERASAAAPAPRRHAPASRPHSARRPAALRR